MRAIIFMALAGLAALALYGIYGTTSTMKSIRRSATVMSTITNFVLAIINALQGWSTYTNSNQTGAPSQNTTNVPLRRTPAQIIDLSL